MTLYLEEKKVAGILVEKEKCNDLSKIIVGIGINPELTRKESCGEISREFQIKKFTR